MFGLFDREDRHIQLLKLHLVGHWMDRQLFHDAIDQRLVEKATNNINVWSLNEMGVKDSMQDSMWSWMRKTDSWHDPFDESMIWQIKQNFEWWWYMSWYELIQINALSCIMNDNERKPERFSFISKIDRWRNMKAEIFRMITWYSYDLVRDDD